MFTYIFQSGNVMWTIISSLPTSHFVDETSSAIILDKRPAVPSTTRPEGLQDEMAAPRTGARRVDSVGSELRTDQRTLPAFG